MRFLFWVYIIIGMPLIRLLAPCKVIGKENFPLDVPLIVCANHTSLFDPVVVFLHLGPKYRMYYMAKQELFRNPIIGYILRAAGAFPVRRGEIDINAVKTSMRHLKNSERVMIFPEGRRVAEGDEYAEAKLGAVRIALKSQAQILPVWLSRGRKIFRCTKIVIGKPFMQEPPADRDFTPLINELMGKISELEPTE